MRQRLPAPSCPGNEHQPEDRHRVGDDKRSNGARMRLKIRKMTFSMGAVSGQ